MDILEMVQSKSRLSPDVVTYSSVIATLSKVAVRLELAQLPSLHAYVPAAHPLELDPRRCSAATGSA